MKKQTAVQWLVEQLNEIGFHTILIENVIEQAKTMEKEQIVNAWNTRSKIDGVLTFTDNRTAEQYYKETYGFRA